LPRYEDITQDGRVQLTALMPGLGAAAWRALLLKLPAIEALRSQGILPILSRLVIMGEERSLSVNVPIRYRGSFRFAREAGGDRLFVNTWVEASAPISSTFEPDPSPDAPYIRVGRMFGEHVLTRPFAPPGERKVTKLDAPGVPPIPEDEHVFESAEDLLGDGALEDAGELRFGMMHTDSNQHVNSLVYPQLFEEAASRRLMQEPRVAGAELMLARAIELRFRRPFFAGDRARLALRLMAPAEGEERWKVGAVGAFTSEAGGAAGGAGAAKPSTTVKAGFR
jgi:hypothetical protein